MLPRGRMRRARRIPGPLALLLATAALCQLAWALAVPALQEPDEASHFSYVQHIAEGQGVPWPGHNGPRVDFAVFSAEERLAGTVGGLEPLRGNLAARPLWTTGDETAYARAVRAAGGDTQQVQGDSSAFANPPLAYLLDVPVYVLTGGSFFDRLYVLRIANVLWLLVAVAATWWLATLVLGGRRTAVVLATGLVAVHPLLTSVSGAVTPDTALVALTTLGLCLAVRVARDGPERRSVALLALVCVLTALTHGRGLALVVPAALAVLLGLRETTLPQRTRRGIWGAAAAVAVVGGVLALRFAEDGALGFQRTRAFASYLWQFYLPKLPGMDPPPFPDWTVRDVFVDRLQGTFAQLDVLLPAGVLDAIATGSLLFLAAAIAAAVARRDTLRRTAPTVAVLVVAVVATLGLVHAQAFRGLLEDPGDPIITGRYLLPLLPVFAIGVAATVSALRGRLHAAAGGVALGLAVLLQLGALGVMLERFYA